MMETQTQPPDDPGTGRYERHDLKMRWLIAFMVLLVCSALGCRFFVSRVFNRLSSHVRAADAPRSAVSPEVGPANSFPSLQPTAQVNHLPAADLQAKLASEDAIFEQLGWQVDRATHRARIPEALSRRIVQQSREAPGGAP